MSSATSPPSRRTAKVSDVRASLPAIEAVGVRLMFHEDFYHWVLRLSWTAFFGWVTVAYVATNTIFGLLFYLVPGGVTNANGFFDCFCFSVETFATIGYGEMAPNGHAAHLIVAVEALLGILAVAVITGLTFARFARPQARILFAQKAVIANRNGVPHLQFRMANWRQNQIAEAQLAVMVLVTETTLEGETMRRPTELKLVRDKNPMFMLTWTAMHPIDESSPFHGKEAMENLRKMNAEIFLTLTGLDETLAQTIHTRYRYRLDDIQPNARFADVLSMREDGVRVIDFDKFHDIVPIEEGT